MIKYMILLTFTASTSAFAYNVSPQEAGVETNATTATTQAWITTPGQCAQELDAETCSEIFDLRNNFGMEIDLSQFKTIKQCLRHSSMTTGQCREAILAGFRSIKQCLRHSPMTRGQCREAMQFSFNSIKQCLRHSGMTARQCRGVLNAALENFNSCVQSAEAGNQCENSLTNATAAIAALGNSVPQACSGDAQNRCPSATTAASQMQCLDDHANVLSSECAQAFFIDNGDAPLQTVELQVGGSETGVN